MWLSLARAPDLGSGGRRFESCHPDARGCSSVVEHQPSKLDMWVRFPSPAFFIAKNNKAVLLGYEKMIRDYVCVDIETTGIRPKWDRIIEIGAVKVRDGEVVDTFSELVNPGIPVPERITELTGITTEMVEDKSGIENVLPQFIEFAGNDIILGHNVRFDYGFLKQNAINLNLQFDKSGLDTLKIARKTLPKEWSKGLECLCKIFGIEDKNHHRAYNDAEVTSKLYMILMNKYRNEFPGLFEAEKLIYKVKKMQPITEKQKKYLIALIRYHNLEIDYEIDSLSKNEASRKIDKIIAENGKIFD